MACDKICIRCGEAFAAKRSNALRCPACRAAVSVERTAARRKRLRAMRPPEVRPPAKRDMDKRVHSTDPPEKIAKCLSCKKTICRGTCCEITGQAAPERTEK